MTDNDNNKLIAVECCTICGLFFAFVSIWAIALYGFLVNIYAYDIWYCGFWLAFFATDILCADLVKQKNLIMQSITVFYNLLPTCAVYLLICTQITTFLIILWRNINIYPVKHI